MYIFNVVKDNIVFFTSSLPKLTFDKLNSNFGLLKAEAAQIDPSLQNSIRSSTSNSNVNFVKGLNGVAEIQEAKVFCIVNKYNELVKASSRLFYSDSIKSKPIYCLFVSKQDAIDFLYKIANTEPTAFKRAGLGINSFSLKEFFKLADNNKRIAEVLLINDLQEVEAFMNKSKIQSKSFDFTFEKGIDFSQPFNGILVYRLNPHFKENPFINKYFLNLNDAVEQWYSFSKSNTDIPKKFRKPLVQLCTISQPQLRDLVL